MFKSSAFIFVISIVENFQFLDMKLLDYTKYLHFLTKKSWHSEKNIKKGRITLPFWLLLT